MSFLGDLFGGGTKVTQTAKQNTTVNTSVDVENDINVSTEAIARVLAEFGLKANQLTEQTKGLIQGISQQNALELIAQLNFKDLIRRRTKQIAIIGSGIFIWFFWFRKKRH